MFQSRAGPCAEPYFPSDDLDPRLDSVVGARISFRCLLERLIVKETAQGNGKANGN